MNSKRIISFFLLFFLLMGPGCYAQDSAVVSSSEPVIITPPAPAQATGQWFDGWYQGASGYDQAMEQFKQTNKPMVVYMSVAWCPYCRRFEKEVLSSPLVRAAMKDMIKVSINPEAGSRENAISFQYGLRGFPSFYLHPPQPAHPVQLYTGVTSERFVEFFKQVLE